MFNLDAPALNADGTLKDASEIEFCHSPSEEQPIIPNTQKKQIRTKKLDQEDDSDLDTLPSLPGLKGKMPARRVASKRVKKASERVKGTNDLGDASTSLFLKSNFIGKSSYHYYLSFMNSSFSNQLDPTPEHLVLKMQTKVGIVLSVLSLSDLLLTLQLDSDDNLTGKSCYH
jgi:hypothetical protein